MNFKKQGVTEITFLTFVFYVKGLQLFPRLLLVFRWFLKFANPPYFMYLSSSGSSALKVAFSPFLPLMMAL